jgi:hypothetical protein
MAIEAFSLDWRQHCGEIDELVEVFGMVPDDCEHSRWDQLRGLLQSAGWQEVLRIRRLLAGLPELVKIIRELGRSRPVRRRRRRQPPWSKSWKQAVARRAETRSVRVPDMPGETRGIHRSDRIARMLPAEAMLLGHPRLRLVWHARRAERSLLCYEDDDRMTETRLHQAPVMQPRPGRRPASGCRTGPDAGLRRYLGLDAGRRRSRGQGRGAGGHARRPCPAPALPRLRLRRPGGSAGNGTAGRPRRHRSATRFLGQAFRGGTDICGPLEKAIAKLGGTRWQLADLLIATRRRIRRHAEVAARLARSSASSACACRAC